MSIGDHDQPDAIGPFTVQRQLGSGGMGVVYLAVSPNGRNVAVKVIRGEYAADPDFRERFTREVAAARAVSGAYTASVLDADTESARPWLATEFVDAPALSSYVKERGGLPAEEVWHLAYGLAEALRDIHRAGVVHRDLKPANVLMGPSGPLVIDFGISRSPEQSTLTTTGRLVGTPPFMAPEQFQSPRDTGPAADLFALGCVLTYAATGHGPFDAEEPYAAAFNVVFQPPVMDGVPDELRPLVLWCLEKQPENRPNPDQVLRFLRDPQTQVVPKPAGSVRRRRPGRRALVTTLAAATLAVLVVLGSSFWTSPGSPAHASSSGSPQAGRPTAPAPLIEPADALRPSGWAVWEKPWTSSGPLAAITGGLVCRFLAGLEVCEATGTYSDKMGRTQPLSMLVAIDPRDGRDRWSMTAPKNEQWSAIASSPDGKLVTATLGPSQPDPTVHTQVSVIGIDTATGATRWRGGPYASDIEGGGLGATDSSRTVLFLGDRYLALDTTAPVAKVVWSHSYQPGDLVSAIPGAPSTAVALGQTPALVQLDQQSGAVLWRAELPRDAVLQEPSLVSTDGKAAVVALGRFAGADRTGWQVRGYARVDLRTGRAEIRTFAHATDGLLASGIGYLVAVRPDGTLTVLNTTNGRTQWSRSLGDAVAATTVSGDRVYFQDRIGKISCYTLTDGRLLWTSASRQQAWAQEPDDTMFVSVAGDLVVAKTARNSLFALEPPTA